jgi:hypothetical protein
MMVCMTSNFEVCTVLGYYVAYSGNSVPKFRYNLSVPSTRIKRVKKNLKHVLYTDTLRIGSFVDGIRMRAKFSEVVQTGPGAPQLSLQWAGSLFRR